jgi:hypothetical protein
MNAKSPKVLKRQTPAANLKGFKPSDVATDDATYCVLFQVSVER